MTYMIEKLLQLSLSNLLTVLFMFVVNIALFALFLFSANLIEWLDYFKELKNYQLIVKLFCLIAFIAVLTFDYLTLHSLNIL